MPPPLATHNPGQPLARRRQRLAGLVLAASLLAVATAPRSTPQGLAAVNVSKASFEAAETPPLIRVLIAQQANLALAAAASPLQLADNRGRPLAEITAEQPFELRQQGAGLVVEIGGSQGQRQTLGPLLGELWISALPAAGRSPLLSVEGRLYRGRLQVRAGADGRLLVINQLPLERYLPSVVGSEMPATWPQAALRAQAVAARTYALSQLKPNSLFDLKATVDSQVYRGVAAETDSTRTAVASTHSQVLMQGNSLINAVFHSSSSGASTENSGEIWSRQLPYLVSVPDFDERSPVHQWQLRLEPEQLRRAFRETGGVNGIEVLSVSSSGRVRRARVSGPAGSLELTGAELRQRLGLRSTLVQTFRLEPVPAERQLPAQPSWIEYLRDSASGAIIGLLAPPPPAVTTAGDDRSNLAVAEPSQPALELVVRGRGFGHGVGMSQWGAYALALKGQSHEQILRHYYRGVELKPYLNP